MLKLLLLACVASFGAADNGRAFLLIEKVRAELSNAGGHASPLLT